MKKTIAFIFAFCTLAAGIATAQDILIEDVQLQAPKDSVVMLDVPELPAEDVVEVPKVDRQLVNHLAAGVPIGFMGNGVGIIEVATTLTPHLQFRLGYHIPIISAVSFTWNDISRIATSMGAGELPKSIDYNGRTINLGPSKFSFGSNLGGINFLMDVFPGKKAGFHFTFGFYYNPSCPDNLLEMRADMSTVLKDAGFTPGQYNEFSFGFNENDRTFRISASPNGVIKAGIRTLPIHPYAGIGFGRAIDPSRRVCVSFDMGVLYWGKPMLVAYDYSLNPSGTAVGFTPERVSASDDLKGMAEPLRIMSMVSLYPMMKLNIFIRIF